jgi:hypothetical protein
VALTRAKQRRGRKEGRRRGALLTSGTRASAEEEKEKKNDDVGRCEGGGKRPAGPKGKGGKFSFFFFFPNLFSILFKSNSNQKPSNFSQNFINILEFTQATKNHAKPNNDAQSLVVSRLIKLNFII